LPGVSQVIRQRFSFHRQISNDYAFHGVFRGVEDSSGFVGSPAIAESCQREGTGSEQA
jgi:hypothetical protein